MSWSGPAAGTAQYQPPPYPTGPPGYGQQQQTYQYGQQTSYNQYQPPPSFPNSGPHQRPPEIRPPKKKGNPIITRYPPPPGYRGPAQPGAFGANQFQTPYQPPTQQYQQGYPAPPHYPNQGYPAPPPPNYPPTPAYSPQSYGPPQSYPSQAYPQTQNYQQSPYQTSQPFSQPASYQNGQSYAQTSYHGYPAQQAAIDNAQPQNWSQQNITPTYSPNDPYNPYGQPPHHTQSISQDPNATPTPALAQPATTQNATTMSQPSNATTDPSQKPPLFLAWDDWDFDFDGAIWPKSNEPVDPNLSLGVIIWRPAKQVTRALPSTFDEAEEQALKPPAEKLGNGESVSVYFTVENSHEAFLDVRQTDEWYRIRNDPIFVVFPDTKDMDLVAIEECIAMRDRPDVPFREVQENEDETMDDISWNIMDNLEQALSGHETVANSSPKISETSFTDRQTQEDILAMLGVTGTPKPHSDEAVPVPKSPTEENASHILPEKPVVPPVPQTPARLDQTPQRAHSYGGHRNSGYGPPPPRPYGSMSVSASAPPPPPPPQRTTSWHGRDAQNKVDATAADNPRGSPARSDASNKTLAGSDFESETPSVGDKKQVDSIPTLQRSDSSFSRKRSYEAADHTDEKLRQQDDHTRRKRRQPEIAAAYSRR